MEKHEYGMFLSVLRSKIKNKWSLPTFMPYKIVCVTKYQLVYSQLLLPVKPYTL